MYQYIIQTTLKNNIFNSGWIFFGLFFFPLSLNRGKKKLTTQQHFYPYCVILYARKNKTIIIHLLLQLVVAAPCNAGSVRETGEMIVIFNMYSHFCLLSSSYSPDYKKWSFFFSFIFIFFEYFIFHINTTYTAI